MCAFFRSHTQTRTHTRTTRTQFTHAHTHAIHACTHTRNTRTHTHAQYTHALARTGVGTHAHIGGCAWRRTCSSSSCTTRATSCRNHPILIIITAALDPGRLRARAVPCRVRACARLRVGGVAGCGPDGLTEVAPARTGTRCGASRPVRAPASALKKNGPGAVPTGGVRDELAVVGVGAGTTTRVLRGI